MAKGNPKGRPNGGYLSLGKCNHPNRPVKARKLCGSCYEQARRQERLPGVNSKDPYVWDLVEELEYHTFSWQELESAFNRPRKHLASALRRVGEEKLIDAVDYKTFGGKPSRGRKKTSK